MLYELNRDNTQPELTRSLAQSMRNALLLPVGKQFDRLEGDLAVLRQTMDADREKLAAHTNDKFTRLEAELELLKKFLHITFGLSLFTVFGVIAIIIMLFLWY